MVPTARALPPVGEHSWFLVSLAFREVQLDLLPKFTSAALCIQISPTLFQLVEEQVGISAEQSSRMVPDCIAQLQPRVRSQSASQSQVGGSETHAHERKHTLSTAWSWSVVFRQAAFSRMADLVSWARYDFRWKCGRLGRTACTPRWTRVANSWACWRMSRCHGMEAMAATACCISSTPCPGSSLCRGVCVDSGQAQVHPVVQLVSACKWPGGHVSVDVLAIQNQSRCAALEWPI